MEDVDTALPPRLLSGKNGARVVALFALVVSAAAVFLPQALACAGPNGSKLQGNAAANRYVNRTHGDDARRSESGPRAEVIFRTASALITVEMIAVHRIARPARRCFAINDKPAGADISRVYPGIIADKAALLPHRFVPTKKKN